MSLGFCSHLIAGEGRHGLRSCNATNAQSANKISIEDSGMHLKIRII